jgi:hypothetical protein
MDQSEACAEGAFETQQHFTGDGHIASALSASAAAVAAAAAAASAFSNPPLPLDPPMPPLFLHGLYPSMLGGSSSGAFESGSSASGGMSDGHSDAPSLPSLPLMQSLSLHASPSTPQQAEAAAAVERRAHNRDPFSSSAHSRNDLSGVSRSMRS